MDGSYAVFDVSGSRFLCVSFFGDHDGFAVTEIEMRWHEETSFQNREISVGAVAPGTEALSSEGKTGPPGLCVVDTTNAEER